MPPTISPPETVETPAKLAPAVAPPSNGSGAKPTATEVKPPSSESDAMRELETLDDPRERPAHKPKAAKKADAEIEGDEPEVAETAKSEKPADTAEEKPAEQKPVKAAELRVAYEKSKETLKTKDAEIAKLQTELKTAKETPADDPDKKLLLEKYESEVKRRTELEKEIEFVAYQKSPKFVNEHQKPYEEAWAKAVGEMTQLTMTLEDGTTRKATSADILSLANAPLDQLDGAAEQMFGKSAARVIRHIEKIRDLSEAQTKALADAQNNSEVRDKERQTQTLQQQQKIKTMWEDENKVWQDKFPRWFKPEDGDTESNALLAKGYEMADAAFSNTGTPEERVKRHAELRNKAAAFTKVALRLKQSRSRIKELEATIASYEESEPPSGEGGKPRSVKPAGDGMDDAFAELDSIGKKK